MLILLPPSETKLRPDAGTPFDIDALTRPALRAARSTMLRAVARTANGRNAGERLGVPAGAPELVERMAEIMAEPAAPVLEVYAGVLFDQLHGARPRPDREVLVQSALLGLVDAATDRIPAYRLSAGSDVQRLGRPGSWWRARLEATGRELMAHVAQSPSPFVLDCRSGAYRAMMPLRSTPEVRVLEVAPVQERAGRRTVISHDAKRYRGVLTRTLLAQKDPIPHAEALIEVLRGAFAGELGVELSGDRLVLVDARE